MGLQLSGMIVEKQLRLAQVLGRAAFESQLRFLGLAFDLPTLAPVLVSPATKVAPVAPPKAKPAARKTASKPAAKTAVKSASKPGARSAAKPTTKPAAKTAAKAPQKAKPHAAQKPVERPDLFTGLPLEEPSPVTGEKPSSGAPTGNGQGTPNMPPQDFTLAPRRGHQRIEIER